MRSKDSTKCVNYKAGKQRADGFRLLDLDQLHAVLLPHVRCVGCKKHGTLFVEAELEARTRRGFASELPLYCRFCDAVTMWVATSKRMPDASRCACSQRRQCTLFARA